MKAIWEVPIVDESSGTPRTAIVYMLAPGLSDSVKEVVNDYDKGNWYIDYKNLRRITNPVVNRLPDQLAGVIWFLSSSKFIAAYYDKEEDCYKHIPSGQTVNPVHRWEFWCDDVDAKHVAEFIAKELKREK